MYYTIFTKELSIKNHRQDGEKKLIKSQSVRLETILVFQFKKKNL